jgi:hypothetical protein
MSFAMNSGFSTKRRCGTLGGFILALLVLALGAIAVADTVVSSGETGLNNS